MLLSYGDNDDNDEKQLMIFGSAWLCNCDPHFTFLGPHSAILVHFYFFHFFIIINISGGVPWKSAWALSEPQLPYL